jgi:large subunit ribosomal protein L10
LFAAPLSQTARLLEALRQQREAAGETAPAPAAAEAEAPAVAEAPAEAETPAES